jgi:hypothetical protein
MTVRPTPPSRDDAVLVQTLLDLVTPPWAPDGARPAEPPPPDRVVRERAERQRAEQERAERDRAQRLATAGVEALGAEAAAVLIVDDTGAPRVFAGTDDGARALAGIEAADRTGTALDCCHAARAEVFEVAAATARWRTWAETAVRHGWGLAETVPLQVRGRTVGGMVLLAGPGRARPDRQRGWAGVLAATAASVVVHQRALADLQRRTDQLQTALSSRIVIEQAKGVLAERGGLDVQTAFDRLRRYARAHRHRLADVAQAVVTGDVADAVLTHVRPGPEPPSILAP